MNPREQYKKLKTEFDQLRAKDTRTEDEETRLDAVMGEMAELEPQLERLARIEQQGRKADDLHQSAGRVGANENLSQEDDREQGGGERGNRTPRLTLGRRVIESEGWKQYKASRGSSPQQVHVGSFWFPSEDTPARGPLERFALITGTGITIEPDRVPGIIDARPVAPTVRDAFINAPTNSNLVTFVRHDVQSDVNAAAAFTEGGATLKAESTIAFDNDEAPVRTIATTVPVTDQILDDEPGLESMINITLLDFLRQTEDDDLLNGDGISPNLKGLLNTTGVQVADDAYFATPGNEINDAGTSNEDINRLTAAATLVRHVGLAEPSFYIVSPAALDYLLTVTNAERDYLAGSPFTTNGIPRFRGLPVIVSNKIADDHAVVGDGRLGAVRDRMAARVDVGYVGNQFALNQKTLRAEERLAFAVYRPAAFVDVTLTFN